MKKVTIFIIVSMLIGVMFVGCKNKDVTEKPPVTSAKLMAPTVVGEVLEVKADGKSILVDSISDLKGKIWLTIDDKTNFFENISEGTSIPYRNVSRKFVIHNHVEIYIEGAVKESYPMQATATSVYVNEPAK
ncbi:MAG TPA: hypothetical protein VIK86_00130 [Candidatus Paceibacterota bacterium]